MSFETSTSPEAETQKPVMDMEPFLHRVPPIEDVFDPKEEVKNLWSVPRDQRRDAIDTFKDKLTRQREAWALCRTSIEDRIEANPKISREEMAGIIGEFAKHYGFAEGHVKIAESLVDDYLKMHKRVVEVRKKFPDDIALINRLTGMKFTQNDAEDFSIEVGPMSIEITCSERNVKRMCIEKEAPFIGFKHGGFALRSRDKKPVYYLVVNNDYEILDPEFYRKIVPHERYHQENRIVAPKLDNISEVRGDVREQLNQGLRGFLRHQIGEKVFRFERSFENEVYQSYESSKDPKKKSFFLAEYMRLRREHALNKVKDELFAMKSGSNSTRLNYNIFMYKGPYDYLVYIRNAKKKKDDSLWQDTAQRILVDEYGSIIDTAIGAFDQLVAGGYTQKEVIAILSDKRMQEWPKTVRRLLEQKQQS